jgi:hypothetical protein
MFSQKSNTKIENVSYYSFPRNTFTIYQKPSKKASISNYSISFCMAFWIAFVVYVCICNFKSYSFRRSVKKSIQYKKHHLLYSFLSSMVRSISIHITIQLSNKKQVLLLTLHQCILLLLGIFIELPQRVKCCLLPIV